MRGKEMAEQMTTYKAVFTREDNGKWAVSAPDVQGAHSWGRSVQAATKHIREAIASLLDLSDEEFKAIELDSTFHVGDSELEALLVRAQETRARLETAKQNASEALQKAVEATHDGAYSMRDVAEMTNVTHSRIQQIEAELVAK
jgi:predicted RNase H-like HicB family nuclease